MEGGLIFQSANSLANLFSSLKNIQIIKSKMTILLTNVLLKNEIKNSKKFNDFCSVGDPWHFGADPDPRICTSD